MRSAAATESAQLRLGSSSGCLFTMWRQDSRRQRVHLAMLLISQPDEVCLQRPSPRWFKGGKRRQPDHHRSPYTGGDAYGFDPQVLSAASVPPSAPGILPKTAAAQAKSLPGLPSTMIWSVYDVGASGYVEASAVADALGKVYGTVSGAVRDFDRAPAAEGAARLARLARHGSVLRRQGSLRVRLAELGPQDLRCLLGRVDALDRHDEDSGIKTLQDMKGERYAYAKAILRSTRRSNRSLKRPASPTRTSTSSSSRATARRLRRWWKARPIAQAPRRRR